MTHDAILTALINLKRKFACHLQYFIIIIHGIFSLLKDYFLFHSVKKTCVQKWELAPGLHNMISWLEIKKERVIV